MATTEETAGAAAAAADAAAADATAADREIGERYFESTLRELSPDATAPLARPWIEEDSPFWFVLGDLLLTTGLTAALACSIANRWDLGPPPQLSPLAEALQPARAMHALACALPAAAGARACIAGLAPAGDGDAADDPLADAIAWSVIVRFASRRRIASCVSERHVTAAATDQPR